MKNIVLPVREIAAIDGRAYEMTVRYSGFAVTKGLWQILWSSLKAAGVELHTFDDRYDIGPAPHRVCEKFRVLRILCEKADEYLDWGQYPLEFPKYPVEEDFWFTHHALDVLQEYYWIRELFMTSHGADSHYRTTGDPTCSVGWFFCLKGVMSQDGFMERAAAWTKEMDDIQNGTRYDFKIVDEHKEVVESFNGCDDLDHLLNPSHLDDPKFVPLLDKVRAEIFT